MELKKLNPNQIITRTDFPLKNPHVLKIYYRVFSRGQGKIMPPVPVAHVELIRPHLSTKLKKQLDEFRQRNPEADYFLLDGSHRTTCAALVGEKIAVMNFISNADIKEAQQMAAAGELFQYILPKTMTGIFRDLDSHFKTEILQTVEQKTQRLCAEGMIPDYMVKNYLN